MNADSLHDRFETLSDLLKQTQSLIYRLSKLHSQSPSLSEPDDPVARTDLSEEIHQNLKDLEQEFVLFQLDVEDTSNGSDRPRLGHGSQDQGDWEKPDLGPQVIKFGEDLKIARAQYRKAQLTAKRNTVLTQRKEREALLAGAQSVVKDLNTPYGRRKPQDTLSQDDILLNASNDITASLARTHSLLSAELQRSQFARETLENSTKELAGLHQAYSNLDSLLNSSRSFLRTLIASQKSDTWYLQSAFYILCVLISWLVFRRILYGPGWWLLYLPLSFIWKLVIQVVQLLIWSLAILAGSLGISKESKALDQENLRLSSKFDPTATARGKLEIPTFERGMPAPSVRVGAGGSGAKSEKIDGQGSRTSMTDDIGKIATAKNEPADETQYQNEEETKLRDRRDDEVPNPKKKTWEEPTESTRSRTGANPPRDEL